MRILLRLASISSLLLAVAPGCSLYFGNADDDDPRSCLGAEDCYPGETCVAGDECLPPPGCERGEACLAVCAGTCVPTDPCFPIGEAYGLRDPVTGACDTSYGGTNCQDGVPVPAGEGAPARDALYWPDWAYCPGVCEGLDEQTCLGADGCRGIYTDPCPGCSYREEPVFAACWGTAPSGPVRGGDCTFLDAYACSLHDDCVAVHEGVLDCVRPDGTRDPACTGRFLTCAPEPNTGPERGCYGDEECLSGERCNAGEVCLPPPGCGANGEACPAVCYGWCVPDEPPPPPSYECTSDAECGPDRRCNEEEVCIPVPCCPDTLECACEPGCGGFCVPVDPPPPPPPVECASDEQCAPGYRCNAAEVCLPPLCDDPAACPDVCWGYCILIAPPPGCCCDAADEACVDVCLTCAPDELCDDATGACVPAPPPPPCRDVWDERACILAGCEPVYEGVDCFCDETGCWCSDWAFLACRDA